ncbi:hypothetical protein EV702DRAFT_1042756 [Suillus placidus]|uniref:Uncharacterized protein n=1 Tax=Suillus placidus TaxID=48579 RepID=A0A9P7A111_9AGAM|nr:hypothetical protein EV702DRAFT_1042756 [Suillus placidus]
MTLNCVKPRRDLPIRLNFDVDVLDSNVGPTWRTPCLFEWDGVSRLAFGDLVRDEKSPVFEECPSPRRTDDVFLHKFIAKMSTQGPALCTAALQDTTYICKAIHEIGLVALGLIKRGVVWVAKISSMQFRMAILTVSGNIRVTCELYHFQILHLVFLSSLTPTAFCLPRLPSNLCTNMEQQPAQTGQPSIPAPPQYVHYPYPQMPQPPLAPSRDRPYPPELYLVYGAPYPVPPQNGGGYPPAFQGTGVPAAAAPTAAAPPSYPSAPSSSQPSHNQHFAQGFGQQQTPVVAARESTVRRGKRKAVNLADDAPPKKKQSIHPSDFDFEMVQVNGQLRYKCCLPQCQKVAPVLYASLQGHIRSKRHQKSAAQLPSPDSGSTLDEAEQWKEFAEMVYSIPSGPLEETVDSLEETVDSASSEPLEASSSTLDEAEQWKEFAEMVYSIPSGPLEETVDSLEETVDSASSEPLEASSSTLDEAEQWKEFAEMVYSIPSGPLEETVDSLEETVDSASSESLEEAPSTLDEAEQWFQQMVYSIPSGPLEETVDSLGETVDSASGEPLEEAPSTLDEAEQWFQQMVYSIPSGPLEETVDSLEETVDLAPYDSESMDDLLDTLFHFRAYC